MGCSDMSYADKLLVPEISKSINLRNVRNSKSTVQRYNLFNPAVFVCFCCESPQWVRTSSFLRFLDHTQRRSTVGRTPLDEWSACRRDLYMTTHNTQNRPTSMPPGGIRTHSLSRRAVADLRLRPRSYWYGPTLLAEPHISHGHLRGYPKGTVLKQFNIIAVRTVTISSLFSILSTGPQVSVRTLSSTGKFKGKGHSWTGHGGPEREERYSSTLSSTSALDGVRWSMPLPGRFTFRKEVRRAPGPVWTGVENPARMGIRSPDCPAIRESLYCLSYPGSPGSVRIWQILKTSFRKISDSPSQSHNKPDIRNICAKPCLINS